MHLLERQRGLLSMGAPIAYAFALAACASPPRSDQPPPCPSPAATERPPGVASTTAPTTAPTTTSTVADQELRLPIVEWSLTRDRYYPQTDRGEGLKRAKSAVVLFAPPPSMFVSGQMGMMPVPTVRLQPVVCSVKGKLEVGARCGEIMPTTAKVRPTGARDMRVARSTQPFVDEAGQQTYPAPFGPACCMYNTCSGRTIPYFGKPTTVGGVRVFPTQTLLAVWPADAEVDLASHVPYVGRDERIDPALWRNDDKVPDLVQVLNIDGRKYVSATRSRTSGLLFVKAATGWKNISERASWEHYVIASFDVDEDGQQEVLVLTRWANDYGLSVYVNGAEKPIYRFSCGNV